MNEYSDFKMALHNVGAFYLVKWYIHNNLVKALQTNDRSDMKFKVHNSFENLHFMDDKKTSSENYVLFNSFSYEINP